MFILKLSCQPFDCATFECVVFSWVRKMGNVVAHSLAQFVFHYIESYSSSIGHSDVQTFVDVVLCNS